MIDNNMQITCTPSSHLRSYTHMQLKANKVIGSKNIYEMDCCIIVAFLLFILNFQETVKPCRCCRLSLDV